MYLNKIALIGFLGRDAETKNTGTGKSVTTLSLATKTSWLTGSERQQRTEWHTITVWGSLAQYAAAFKKGAQIMVEGELRSREYANAQGVTVRTYDVVANTILNLRAGQRNNTQEPPAAEAPTPEPEPEPQPEPATEPPAPKARRKRSRKHPAS